MHKFRGILLAVLLVPSGVLIALPAPAPKGSDFSGSASCRECHQKFYALWAPSHHGLAMQPWSIAKTNVTPHVQPLKIGTEEFQADITNGVVVAHTSKGEKRYAIEQALGGKNVLYFLTPFERGRLQVLPLAYDLNRREWYDTAASAVRHVGGPMDTPLHWTEPPYTFNTSCYNCHVSQLTNNYSLKTDSYTTSWGEPGINCETCHGPAGEHIRAARQLAPGQPMRDLKLISTKPFSPEQVNSLCGVCHAKMHALTTAFGPGSRYFDHFGLAGIEESDFYPDGRDLGENFTLTSWELSRCAQAGQLHCVKCHTSSGRNRFTGSRAAESCLPCHEQNVTSIAAHSHHKQETGAPTCIDCHMPKTEFARMQRSDHSMRPPMPAATIAFGSPNACNLCHTNKDAAWADHEVRQWHKRDYQASTLQKGQWLAAARKRDWSPLPEILKYLSGKTREEIWSAAFINLLRGCDRPEKWPAIQVCLEDRSPMVRAAAVDALSDQLQPAFLPALFRAAADDYRLVRVRAAAALAGIPASSIPADTQPALARANRELLASFTARPDSPASYQGLGNYYLQRQEPARALEAFRTALRLQPDDVGALVNAALTLNSLGQNDEAERNLRQALKAEPTNAVVNLNLGMLLAEMNKMSEAEQAFRAALKADPRSAQAAFNLGVLLAERDPAESLGLCARAAELNPHEPRYAYTLAFYQNQQGRGRDAANTLEKLISTKPAYPDAYTLLGRIYTGQNKTAEAAAVYKLASENTKLDQADRYRFAALREALESGQ